MVDLDVSAWREVDLDVFGFWGLLSGRFRCFLDLPGVGGRIGFLLYSRSSKSGKGGIG